MLRGLRSSRNVLHLAGALCVGPASGVSMFKHMEACSSALKLWWPGLNGVLSCDIILVIRSGFGAVCASIRTAIHTACPNGQSETR